MSKPRHVYVTVVTAIQNPKEAQHFQQLATFSDEDSTKLQILDPVAFGQKKMRNGGIYINTPAGPLAPGQRAKIYVKENGVWHNYIAVPVPEDEGLSTPTKPVPSVVYSASGAESVRIKSEPMSPSSSTSSSTSGENLLYLAAGSLPSTPSAAVSAPGTPYSPQAAVSAPSTPYSPQAAVSPAPTPNGYHAKEEEEPSDDAASLADIRREVRNLTAMVKLLIEMMKSVNIQVNFVKKEEK